MAVADENPSMNPIEIESTQFYPGNKPVLMMVAGLSCIIAGIVQLVQCGRQNQDDGNSENATAHGYERARIGLRFLTTGLSLILKAYRVDWNLQHWNPIPLQIIAIICEILFIMFPIIAVNFINGSAQELNPFTH